MSFDWLKVEQDDEKWFTDRCLFQWFENGDNSLISSKEIQDLPPLIASWVLTESEDEVRNFADCVLSIPAFEPKLLFAVSTVFINPAKTTALTNEQLKHYQKIFFTFLAKYPELICLSWVDILWKFVSEETNNDVDFRREIAEICFTNVDCRTTTMKFNKSLYLFWSRQLIASPSLETLTQMQKIAIFSIIYSQTQKRFPRFWVLFPYSSDYIRLMEPLEDDEVVDENRQYELIWRIRSGDNINQKYYQLFAKQTQNKQIEQLLKNLEDIIEVGEVGEVGKIVESHSDLSEPPLKVRKTSI